MDCDGREGLVAGWGVGASLWSVMEGKGGRWMGNRGIPVVCDGGEGWVVGWGVGT